MLFIARHLEETVTIKTSDGDLILTVTEIRRDRVKLGFVGPDNVRIYRTEIDDGRYDKPEDKSDVFESGYTEPRCAVPGSGSKPQQESTDESPRNAARPGDSPIGRIT
jgi:carbon storage regulator CsrA